MYYHSYSELTQQTQLDVFSNAHVVKWTSSFRCPAIHFSRLYTRTNILFQYKQPPLFFQLSFNSKTSILSTSHTDTNIGFFIENFFCPQRFFHLFHKTSTFAAKLLCRSFQTLFFHIHEPLKSTFLNSLIILHCIVRTKN